MAGNTVRLQCKLRFWKSVKHHFVYDRCNAMIVKVMVHLSNKTTVKGRDDGGVEGRKEIWWVTFWTNSYLHCYRSDVEK